MCVVFTILFNFNGPCIYSYWHVLMEITLSLDLELYNCKRFLRYFLLSLLCILSGVLRESLRIVFLNMLSRKLYVTLYYFFESEYVWIYSVCPYPRVISV